MTAVSQSYNLSPELHSRRPDARRVRGRRLRALSLVVEPLRSRMLGKVPADPRQVGRHFVEPARTRLVRTAQVGVAVGTGPAAVVEGLLEVEGLERLVVRTRVA